jgi:phosphoglycolate phosphatase
MSYNLCLFDLDGTLTNPKEGITKSVRYALTSFGIEVDNLDELTKFIMTIQLEQDMI